MLPADDLLRYVSAYAEVGYDDPEAPTDRRLKCEHLLEFLMFLAQKAAPYDLTPGTATTGTRTRQRPAHSWALAQ
jgi:hypothetical protein